MAVNINVTEDENSIDINDVNVFTVHVKDLSTPGQIQISEDSSDITEDTVDTITEIRTINLPADQPINISVNEISSDTVTIITTDTNVIEVSDNISIVTAASEAASQQLRGFTGDSLWNQFGNDATYTQGNVGIGTNLPNSKLEVVGNIEATSFTGTFIGALSSSAQIAADISGAFASFTTTISTNTDNISTNTNNISTNTDNISINANNISALSPRLTAIETASGSLSQSVIFNTTNIAANLTKIDNQILVSASLQSRLSNVEAGSTSKTLVSGSSQIKLEISGAFVETSHSIQDRLSNVETNINNTITTKTLVSSSLQIATEISGAFVNVSSSLQSRLSNVEVGSTSKTLVSGSAQLAAEISGAFVNVSSSLQSRLSNVEVGSTSKTLVSGSAQLATEISGAFVNVSESLSNRAVSLEQKVDQSVNTSSDVEFASIDVTGNISASGIRTTTDVQIGGNISVEGGSIFGLGGFGVTIDDISVLTGSNQFGSSSTDLHGFTGSVSITGSVSVTGSISAHSYTGIFNGALSSSTQIGTEISGAFVAASHSLQSRLSLAESELGNTLISGSAQIATEISGAFVAASHSLQSRISIAETELNNTLISGSAQIGTEISGAFVAASHSLQSRLTITETELNNTLISGSAQIATEISGAFVAASHSLQSRLTATETELSNTLISGSAQIATEISGAFKNITQNDDASNFVVVYDSSAHRFYYTGSYGTSNTTNAGTVTKYATASADAGTDLTKLIVNDYTSDGTVSVTTDGGILQLTFGTPTIPYFTNFNAIGFDANRFNKEIDDYELNIDFDLRGNSFVKGELSASTNNADSVGIATFNNGENITINSAFTSYQSGSHTFKANITSTLSSGDTIISSEILDLELNKTVPNDPVITFPNISLTGNNSADLNGMEIEEGAVGNITFNVLTTDPDGWTEDTPSNNSYSTELEVTKTGNVNTGTVEEYWTSGTDNDPIQFYTGSQFEEFERVRSLRYKLSSGNAIPTVPELQELDNWTGVIKSGVNTISEIEEVTLEFNPTNIAGEFIYIIYDAALGNLSEINNATLGYNEISTFDAPSIAAINGVDKYKIYIKSFAIAFPSTLKLKF